MLVLDPAGTLFSLHDPWRNRWARCLSGSRKGLRVLSVVFVSLARPLSSTCGPNHTIVGAKETPVPRPIKPTLVLSPP